MSDTNSFEEMESIQVQNLKSESKDSGLESVSEGDEVKFGANLSETDLSKSSLCNGDSEVKDIASSQTELENDENLVTEVNSTKGSEPVFTSSINCQTYELTDEGIVPEDIHNSDLHMNESIHATKNEPNKENCATEKQSDSLPDKVAVFLQNDNCEIQNKEEEGIRRRKQESNLESGAEEMKDVQRKNSKSLPRSFQQITEKIVQRTAEGKEDGGGHPGKLSDAESATALKAKKPVIDSVNMKRQMGLVSGISIIAGTMIGKLNLLHVSFNSIVRNSYLQ